jgi:hypothetical protein
MLSCAAITLCFDADSAVLCCVPPARARTQTGYQYLSLYRGPVGDKSQRTVHYAITGSTRFVYAAAVRVFILKVRAILLPANTWRRRIKRTRRA